MHRGLASAFRGSGWISLFKMKFESHRSHPDVAAPQDGAFASLVGQAVLSRQTWRAVAGPAPELPSPRPVPVLPQTLLQHLPEQEEMRAFPGPLGKYVPPGCPGRLSGGRG